MKVLASIPSVTVLGISPAMSERMPLRSYTPPKINPEARPYWHQALADDKVRETIERKTPKEAWFALIQQFYILCEDADILPLYSRDDGINDAVRRMLMNRRHKLRIYIDRANLFESTRIIPMSQKHTWKFLKNGNLLLTAQIGLEHDGLAAIRKRVQSRTAKMFWNALDNSWSFAVTPDLKVFVKGITRNRMVLMYQLEIRMPYYIPEDNRLLRDKKDYLDKEFFYPMTRGIRFTNVKRRIQF